MSFWLVRVTLCTPGVSKVLEYKTTCHSGENDNADG